MDIALKQRLVGATVLVALGVIFIPMLLDGPGAGRESVRLPTPPDNRFESRLLPVDPPTASPVVQVDPVARAPEEVPGSSQLVVIPNTVNTEAPQETPAQPEPVLPTPQATPQLSSTATRGGAPEQAKQAWVVQLGSFGNAANATRLVESLKQQSLGGYQEKIELGGSVLYRVRMGPWSSKTQAAEAGEQVSIKFPELAISIRQVDAGDASKAAVSVPGTGWMVQLGSFSKQQNALTLRDKLRAGGFDAAVENRPGGSYKVVVGPSLNRVAAEKTRDRIKQQFKINGIVLSHP